MEHVRSEGEGCSRRKPSAVQGIRTLRERGPRGVASNRGKPRSTNSRARGLCAAKVARRTRSRPLVRGDRTRGIARCSGRRNRTGVAQFSSRSREAARWSVDRMREASTVRKDRRRSRKHRGSRAKRRKMHEPRHSKLRKKHGTPKKEPGRKIRGAQDRLARGLHGDRCYDLPGRSVVIRYLAGEQELADRRKMRGGC
jgi:hypothetical protein